MNKFAKKIKDFRKAPLSCKIKSIFSILSIFVVFGVVLITMILLCQGAKQASYDDAHYPNTQKLSGIRPKFTKITQGDVYELTPVPAASYKSIEKKSGWLLAKKRKLVFRKPIYLYQRLYLNNNNKVDEKPVLNYDLDDFNLNDKTSDGYLQQKSFAFPDKIKLQALRVDDLIYYTQNDLTDKQNNNYLQRNQVVPGYVYPNLKKSNTYYIGRLFRTSKFRNPTFKQAIIFDQSQFKVKLIKNADLTPLINSHRLYCYYDN